MNEWEKKQSENLTDRYVKKIIVKAKFSKEIGLKTSDITPEDIELKRNQLVLYREIKQYKKELREATSKGKYGGVLNG